MTLESKFNEGNVVWFFEPSSVKFMQGTIMSLQSWDKWMSFRYEIKHFNDEGVPMMYNIEERNIFLTKEEILDGLFIEDGTPVEPNTNK